jgi:RNA polymerase sigma-70 factor (ECF subfamily)
MDDKTTTAERPDESAEISDAQLIRQFKDGRQAAFDQLVIRHQRRIYAITRRMTGSHDDADDLAQETFLAAYRAMERFDERQSFIAFISRIAINLCINHLRRRRRWLKIQTQRPEEAARASTGRVHSDLGEQMERDEMMARLQEAIAALPPEQKAVLVLKVYEEMSYREIASTLKISPGTVMSRLSRARERLRKRIKDKSLRSRGECS